VSVRTQDPPPSPLGDVAMTLRRSLLPACIPRVDARSQQTPFDQQIVTRVRGEFLEMPGLSPTLAQAARLFALPTTDCQQVLGLLTNDGFLRCGPDGHYRLTARR